MTPPRLLDCENALIFFLYSLGQNASVVAHKVSQLRHQLYFSTSQKDLFSEKRWSVKSCGKYIYDR